MRLIDADALLSQLDGILSDYTSRGLYPNGFTIESAIDAVVDMPTLTPPPRWVSVEERLPDEEAKQYIQNKLNGIGYLYPCLLAYRSPNSERIHVVRFYYDITQKWFVNSGERLCEKDRCIAWMPLPEPPEATP